MESFANLAYLLAFTCIVALIVNYLKFPLVLGYILVGILIGPQFLNFIPDLHSLDLLAKIGIVSLLFIIGLNLNPKIIRQEAKQSFILGTLQIVVTTLFGLLIFHFGFGLALGLSLLLATTLTLSSTIIVLKMITDKGDSERLYAKMSLGVLLIQDFFATFLLLALSLKHSAGLASHNLSYALQAFGIKILILLAIYFLLSKWILPRAAKLFTKSPELLLLFALAFSFLYAYLFEAFGFSLEIGALFAGIIMSNLDFAKDIASRFRPIRDFFIIIFFILLGLQADFSNLAHSGSLILVLSLFVIFLNPLILFLIMNLLGHNTRTSFYTGLTMGQVSEFSLVVLAIAEVYGYIDKSIFSVILVVMLISICFSSYLIVYADQVYARVKPFLKFLEIKREPKHLREELAKNLDLVIFGYDKVSRDFLELAKEKNYNYLIIDIDPEAVLRAKKDGGLAILGDAENIIFLEENHILEAKMLISTIPYFEINLNLLNFYKKLTSGKNNPKIAIMIAYQVKQARVLYTAGADYIILPYHMGVAEVARQIAEFNFKQEKFATLKQELLTKLES